MSWQRTIGDKSQQSNLEPYTIADAVDFGDVPTAGQDGYAIVWDNTAGKFVLGTAGVSDHGALSGLADDDHTQYLLADGSRAGATAGAQTFTNGLQAGAGLQSGFVDIQTGTLPTNAAPLRAYNLETTLPVNHTSSYIASLLQFNPPATGDSPTNGVITAMRLNMGSGYTGSNSTYSLVVTNSATGTANTLIKSGTPFGNVALVFTAVGATTGAKIGVTGFAREGDITVGGLFRAGFTETGSHKAGAVYIGAAGVARNETASGGKNIGVMAGLFDTNTITYESAALLADNGTTLVPIFVARDNQATVFSIVDGGNLRLAAITAPAAPVDGDMWKNTDEFVMHAAGSNTNTILNTLRLRRGTSGTPAAGFGSGLNFQLKSSTTVGQDAALITASWLDATHATRGSRSRWSTYYTTTENVGVTIGSNSSGALLSFYDVSTPVARQLLATGGGATVDQVITALQNLGLLRQS